MKPTQCGFLLLKRCVTSIHSVTVGSLRKPYHYLWEIEHFITVLTSRLYNILLHFIYIDKNTKNPKKKMLHVWITWPLKYNTWLDPHNWSCRTSEHRSSSWMCLLLQMLLCRLSFLWLCVKEEGINNPRVYVAENMNLYLSNYATVIVTAQKQWNIQVKIFHIQLENHVSWRTIVANRLVVQAACLISPFAKKWTLGKQSHAVLLATHIVWLSTKPVSKLCLSISIECAVIQRPSPAIY